MSCGINSSSCTQQRVGVGSCSTCPIDEVPVHKGPNSGDAIVVFGDEDLRVPERVVYVFPSKQCAVKVGVGPSESGGTHIDDFIDVVWLGFAEMKPIVWHLGDIRPRSEVYRDSGANCGSFGL